MDDAHNPSASERLSARLRIVDGLVAAMEAGPPLLEAIQSCPDRRAAHQMLRSAPWNFDTEVAHHILDLPYGRNTELGRAELRSEVVELRQQLHS